MKKYVFSSSKMSGLPNNNRKGFFKKKKELEKKYRWRVYDQFEHECGGSWSDEMLLDLQSLEEKCWAIYMWGQWYRSQGAWIELLSAHRLGFRIIIEQQYLRWVEWVLDLIFKYKRKTKNK